MSTNDTNLPFSAEPETISQMDAYDPFSRGRFPVGVRTLEELDTARQRLFPCEVWYPAATGHAGQDLDPATQDVFTGVRQTVPRRQLAVRNAAAQPGTYPLVVFSHSSGGDRRQSTFLCTHLSSHGYVVVALDHSDVVAPELQRRDGETVEQRAARVDAWIANRVPDIRFLLDELLRANDAGGLWEADAGMILDPERIGIVGHSFGGWTALATSEADQRIRAVVALTPGGTYQPPPDIIPAQLSFVWGRDVPTLYLVAANDSFLPLSGMYELFARTEATKRMVILQRADHGHFADEFEIQAELCSPEQAHAFTHGLTLCHLDAILKRHEAAERFWTGNVEGVLAARGIEATDVREVANLPDAHTPNTETKR